jgi:hypothetical protein
MDKILITTPEGNVGLATLRQLKKHPNRANLTLIGEHKKAWGKSTIFVL